MSAASERAFGIAFVTWDPTTNHFPGIGAEYPLSAVITSEWSSTSSRATMLSSVFLMQPVGQALAQVVGVLVLLGQDAAYGLHDKRCGLDSLHEEECKKIIDGIWRWVIGSGAVPAVLAIIFRFFLYDCGLYTLEVKNKPGNAFRDTQRVYGAPMATNGMPMTPHGLGSLYPPEPMPVQFSLKDLHTFLIKDKNWYYLLGTSMTWFFLDVSFYGFSLDNRGTLADLWATTDKPTLGPNLPCWDSSLTNGTSLVPGWLAEGLPTWQTDDTMLCNTIYEVIIEQTKQYLLTVSIASIAGSACFIFFANRIPRRQWLTSSFIILTVLFLVTGGVYYGVAHTPRAPATVVFVAICHFMFNFGKQSQAKQTKPNQNHVPLQLPYAKLTLFSSPLLFRRQHLNLHHPRRDLPHLLPFHLPRHLGRGRQAGEHRRRPDRLRHQLGLLVVDPPGPHLPALRLLHGPRRALLVGLPARRPAGRVRRRRRRRQRRRREETA